MKKTTGESHKSDLVTLELPAEFINKYLELLRPLDENIEYNIQKKLDQHIGSPEMGGELYGQGKPFNSQDPEAMQDQVYRPVHHETKKTSRFWPGLNQICRKSSCPLLLVTEEFNSEKRKFD